MKKSKHPTKKQTAQIVRDVYANMLTDKILLALFNISENLSSFKSELKGELIKKEGGKLKIKNDFIKWIVAQIVTPAEVKSRFSHPEEFVDRPEEIWKYEFDTNSKEFTTGAVLGLLLDDKNFSEDPNETIKNLRKHIKGLISESSKTLEDMKKELSPEHLYRVDLAIELRKKFPKLGIHSDNIHIQSEEVITFAREILRLWMGNSIHFKTRSQEILSKRPPRKNYYQQ